MEQIWELYQVHLASYVQAMKPLFDNENVVRPKNWKPTGDWYKDLIAAWEAGFSGTIRRVNDTHHEFTELSGFSYPRATYQMVPELEPLYPFKETEGIFEGSAVSAWMREYYQFPIAAVTAYALFLIVGNIVMYKLPAFELTGPLFLWNLFLSAFSWIGVIRTVPHLLATIKTYGLYGSICRPVEETFGACEVGLWACLFIWSKVPELVDTVFIVLRKKPLIFLHWYHHITVLLYCFQSYSTQNSAGIYFICMNYSVHAIMYGYYALKAVNMWPRFIPSWIITILQLSQMIVGVAICIMTYKYKEVDHLPCSVSRVSELSGAAMYFSYFLLFLQILFQLLTKGVPKKKTSKTKKNQ